MCSNDLLYGSLVKDARELQCGEDVDDVRTIDAERCACLDEALVVGKDRQAEVEADGENLRIHVGEQSVRILRAHGSKRLLTGWGRWEQRVFFSELACGRDDRAARAALDLSKHPHRRDEGLP